MESSSTPAELFRFGLFEADLRSGELRKNGTKVKIQERPFRALRVLLSRPNEVVSREDLRQALWPDGVFVDFDHGISSAMNRLRDALGDAADNPIFIETVERRGYRWIAPIQTAAPLTHASVEPPPEPPLASAQESTSTPASDVSTSPTPLEPVSRWAWALPALTLIFAVWLFRSSHLGTHANALNASSAARLPDKTVHDPTAQELYLRGRFYWNKRTPDDLNKAVDYFTQSIVHDSSYAPAYVGLADCYNLLREYTMMPASEAYPRALAAARKAEELDPKSSAAHASVAFALAFGMRDARTAEDEFRQAILLDPSNATAHHWFATFLISEQRCPESIHEIDRAEALDPTSRSILADRGIVLAACGRKTEAMTLLRQIETTEPDFVSPHRYLKTMYLEDGDYPAYLAESEEMARLLRDSAGLTIAAAAKHGFATGGIAGMWAATIAVQQKLYDQGAVSPYELAESYARAGRQADALRFLQIAAEKHDELMVNVRGDTAFTSLRSDPEFQGLASRTIAGVQ
jgi:DNA-binding winged helix-turn-helix (wHTH) protein/tetratricopeptide (TPR) repeat protein